MLSMHDVIFRRGYIYSLLYTYNASYFYMVILCVLYTYWLEMANENRLTLNQERLWNDGIRIWGNIAKKHNASGLVIFFWPRCLYIMGGYHVFHVPPAPKSQRLKVVFFPGTGRFKLVCRHFYVTGLPPIWHFRNESKRAPVRFGHRWNCSS